MEMYKSIIRRVNFDDCGLDIEHNILQAPLCSCGCGNYANLVIEDEEDLRDFIGEMLAMQECNHCAIFVLHNDGKTVTLGESDGEYINFVTLKDKAEDTWNADIVKEVQDELEFHCYGLLEQLDDGDLYRIVME